jgi:sugar/nucleoside kinase (ribokinase family)
MEATLLAFGLTTLDIVARPIDALTHTERTTLIDGISCTPAGTAGGAAMVAARLGLTVRIAGGVGDDLCGSYVRTGLKRSGVDTGLMSVMEGLTTSTTLLTVETSGRRSSYHAPGAGRAAPVTPEIIAAARQARFVHYGGIGGLASDGGPGEQLICAAREAGAIVTCDLVRPRGEALPEVKRLLPQVDYFMPSAAEARMLSGLDDLSSCADYFLGLGARACIIKDGEYGSYAAIDGVHRRLPALPVDAVDTTSCGDSYCAGFIAGLAQGWLAFEACKLATVVAARVAQGLGTLGKLEGLDESIAAMREARLEWS